MSDPTTLTDTQNYTQIDESHHICQICHRSGGEYLFFHPSIKKWLHKRCFEEYTCHDSLDCLKS